MVAWCRAIEGVDDTSWEAVQGIEAALNFKCCLVGLQ